MAFLQVEGGTAFNLDLVDKIEFNHNKKQATLWTGGVIQHPDSEVAYTYLMQNPGMVVMHEPIVCKKCGGKSHTMAMADKHVCPEPEAA